MPQRGLGEMHAQSAALDAARVALVRGRECERRCREQSLREKGGSEHLGKGRKVGRSKEGLCAERASEQEMGDERRTRAGRRIAYLYDLWSCSSASNASPIYARVSGHLARC